MILEMTKAKMRARNKPTRQRSRHMSIAMKIYEHQKNAYAKMKYGGGASAVKTTAIAIVLDAFEGQS